MLYTHLTFFSTINDEKYGGKKMFENNNDDDIDWRIHNIDIEIKSKKWIEMEPIFFVIFASIFSKKKKKKICCRIFQQKSNEMSLFESHTHTHIDHSNGKWF